MKPNINKQDIPPVQNTTKERIGTPPIVNQKGSIPLILGVVILLIVVAGGAYYLRTKKGNLITPQQTNPLPSQTTNNLQNVSPTSTPSVPSSNLPTDWTYKTNNECAVKFALPPKKEPYYSTLNPNSQPSVTNDDGSGRFWDFPRGVVYPNLLSKFPNGSDNYKQASAMYAATEEASGYVSSAVVVSCIPNTNNLNNLTMLNLIKTKLQEYNQGTAEKGMQPSTYTIKTSNEVARWDQKAYDLVISEYYSNSGGQPYANSVDYTIFTTPKYLYEVRIMGATNGAFVKETAKKIFENLRFE